MASSLYPKNSTSNDSLTQLLRSVMAHRDSGSPYRLLLQYDTSIDIRQQLHAEYNESLYQTARLLTPVEAARLDWNAPLVWLRYMLVHALRQPAIGLQLLPRRQTWLDACNKLISCHESFGWDNNSTINNLEESIRKQLNDTHCPAIFLDSVVPLLQLHSLDETISFLCKLSARLIVIPVDLNVLDPYPHAHQLEAISHATLKLVNGTAVLLRQGVREEGNWLRHELPYRIVRNNSDDTMELILIQQQQQQQQKQQKNGNQAVAAPSNKVTDDETPTQPGKLKLQVTEGGRQSTTVAATPNEPNIFMQDDDPEFEDFDEEDPDDDLDI